MPVAAREGRIGGVGPVLPEVTEGGDPPPFTEAARDSGIEHGERHGANDGQNGHHERQLSTAERLADGDEGTSPAPSPAGACDCAHRHSCQDAEPENDPLDVETTARDGDSFRRKARILLAGGRYGDEGVDSCVRW